jgi:hypothetical protein
MLYKIVHQIYVHQHNLVKKNYFADKKRQLKLAIILSGFNKWQLHKQAAFTVNLDQSIPEWIEAHIK